MVQNCPLSPFNQRGTGADNGNRMNEVASDTCRPNREMKDRMGQDRQHDRSRQHAHRKDVKFESQTRRCEAITVLMHQLHSGNCLFANVSVWKHNQTR